MSANIEASLRLQIAQYQAALATARGDITKLKEHAKREGAGLGQNLFRGIVAFAAGGTILSLGKASLDTVVKMDRMNRAMTTMEGSAAGAQARLAELREAARLPGIGFEQAVQGDIRLRSVGLSAETSKQALIEFGNALALSGGSAADLDGVILALGQISSKGKVSAEEINQIAERVPQIRAVMKNVFGTADTETIQKMNISANEFITRTIAGFGQLDRASAGLDESLSDIEQNFKSLIVEVAAPLVERLVPAFAEFTSHVTENKEAFAALGSTLTLGLDALSLYGDAIMGLAKLRAGIGFAMAGDSSGDIVDPRLLEKARKAGLGATADQVEANRVGNRGTFADKVLSSGYVEGQDQAAVPAKKKAVEKQTPADAPIIEDKAASAKALKEAEQARTNLMREQQQLAEMQMQEYLDILPPNLKLLEVQREILRIKDDIENLPMHELDKIKLQQELVKWNNAERDAKRDITEEAKRAADEQKAADEVATGNADALAQFQAEMALIDAKLAKDKELTAELERQMQIQQLQNQLMSDAGLTADEALRRATERVDKEADLKKQIEAAKNSRYDSEGRRADGRKQIKGYSAETQGDAGDARARAEQRVAAARDRVQGRMDSTFGSLDDQTRKNAANGTGLANQAQQNAQKDAAQNNPQQQAGQQIVALVTQILEAVK